jgi:glycosyltransferase involved in cell wall biosynthesis
MLVHDVQWGLVDSLRGQMLGLASALRHNERQCLQLADTVAVLTEEMGDAVRELGVTKPIVVTPLWATIDADPALVEDGPLEVQYSGNFGEKQGVSVLLTFGERLAEEAPEARLVLRGAGPRFDALRVDAAARRLDVRFEDPVPDVELAPALARSPVHLSVESVGGGRYAMPSKVVNALAAGALVVAMAERRSPLTNLASELSGVSVVPVGDVAGAVDEAARLLRAPDLRERRLASQREAAARFSRDAVLQSLEAAIVGGVPAATP